jgi:hypothetical protein
MKWLKASLWLISLVILLAVGAGAVGWFMLRGTPAWYRPGRMPAEQRKKNADDFEDKLINLTNMFGEKNAAAYRAAHLPPSTHPEGTASEQAKQLRDRKGDEPVEIQFTDDQLNAFFEKWAEFQNRRALFDQYVDSPRVIMKKDRLIFAGRVKDLDLIVSMEFNPGVDDDGNLRMNLVQVMGGILPMPDSMWEKQRHGVEKMLEKKLPGYQRDASISSDGYANGAAASAAMNEMILAALRGGKSSAVVFVPGSIEHLSPTIPVRITSVSVDDHTLTLQAEPMTTDEREELLKRIKAFDPMPPAPKPSEDSQ